MPIPQGYYDLTEAEQEAICPEMADALIEQLGARHNVNGTVQSANPAHQA